MTEYVLDASVVLKWFHSKGEHHVNTARSLRSNFETGALLLFAPPLLKLEIVNVAARRWGLGESGLIELAANLDELGLEFVEPELTRVARWTAAGLTAYDAAYVAVAEAGGIKLVTDDQLIVATAPEIAELLSDLQLT